MAFAWPFEPMVRVPSNLVNNLNEMKPGDHIKFKRYMYSHHAIVMKVDAVNNEYTVIHYASNNKSQFERKANIMKETKRFKRNTVHLIMYSEFFKDPLKRLPNDLTLDIAKCFIDNRELLDPYTVLMNNCEHFAFSCTLGYAISYQERNARRIFLAPFIRLGSHLTRDRYGSYKDYKESEGDIGMRKVVDLLEYKHRVKFINIKIGNTEKKVPLGYHKAQFINCVDKLEPIRN